MITDALGNTFRFAVEIGGLAVGGFMEVGGLQSEIEYEEIPEGGVNGRVHRLPKRTTTPPLVLRRGITKSTDLWDWYKQASDGKVKLLDGSIILYDASWGELNRWEFTNAYPVKWLGPELNSSRSEVAIETLELVHMGFKKL